MIRKAARPNPLMQSTKAAGRPDGTLAEEFAQASDRRISNYDNKVFATNEQDTERDRDAQARPSHPSPSVSRRSPTTWPSVWSSRGSSPCSTMLHPLAAAPAHGEQRATTLPQP